MKEIYELTASEVRNKILNKELTSFEVVNAIFDRIEKTDELIGSFVSLRKEKALEEAKLIDEKIARGEKVGYLAGVPVAIKDNMVSKGWYHLMTLLLLVLKFLKVMREFMMLLLLQN